MVRANITEQHLMELGLEDMRQRIRACRSIKAARVRYNKIHVQSGASKGKKPMKKAKK